MKIFNSDAERFIFLTRGLYDLSEQAQALGVTLSQFNRWLAYIETGREDFPASATRENMRERAMRKRRALLHNLRNEPPYPILEVRVPPEVRVQRRVKSGLFSQTIGVNFFGAYDNENALWYIAHYAINLLQYTRHISLRVVAAFEIGDTGHTREKNYADVQLLSTSPLLIQRGEKHAAIVKRVWMELARLEGVSSGRGKLLAIHNAFYSPAKIKRK